MRVNQKYVQSFGDALIPILGYFFWNWNLYFIVLFYLLDLIASEVFMYFKSKKILQVQGGKWKENLIPPFTALRYKPPLISRTDVTCIQSIIEL